MFIERRTISVDMKVHKSLVNIRNEYNLRSFSAVIRFILNIPPSERKYGITEKLSGRDLKQLYEDHHHHQSNLAKTLGISRQRVHQILNKIYPEAPRRARNAYRFTHQMLLDTIEKIGYDKNELALHFKCAPSTIEVRMKAFNIQLPEELRPVQGPPKLLTLESYNKAFTLKKGSGRNMAKYLGVSVMTVWRASKRYDCPLRDSRVR